MSYHLLEGDVIEQLRLLPNESVHCVVTSPPYWGLRDYGVTGQMGLEATPQEFIAKMVEVFSEVKRVLRSDGTCWINMGDSYAFGGCGSRNPGRWPKQSRNDHQAKHSKKAPGLKPKDLCGIPWRLAFALQDNGWWLRQDIIWAKPNGMPGSQHDRCTSSHEYVFMLTKSATYWSDFDSIKTPPRESSLVRLAQDIQSQAGSHRANGSSKTNGSMKAVHASDKQRGHSRQHEGFNDRWDAMNKQDQQSSPAMMRDVWFISPAAFSEAHFAVMPEELARRCILAGCPEDGIVLDPFSGSGTTGMVALRHHRRYMGIELNPEYVVMARRRIRGDQPLFNVVHASEAYSSLELCLTDDDTPTNAEGF